MSAAEVCGAGLHPMSGANLSARGHCKRCAADNRRRSRAAERAAQRPPLARPPAWMDDALCAQADPEAWFPEQGESARLAKLICSACPVRAECLEYALDRRQQHGVWGGMSEAERRAELRRRAAERRAA